MRSKKGRHRLKTNVKDEDRQNHPTLSLTFPILSYPINRSPTNRILRPFCMRTAFYLCIVFTIGLHDCQATPFKFSKTLKYSGMRQVLVDDVMMSLRKNSSVKKPLSMHLTDQAPVIQSRVRISRSSVNRFLILVYGLTMVLAEKSLFPTIYVRL